MQAKKDKALDNALKEIEKKRKQAVITDAKALVASGEQLTFSLFATWQPHMRVFPNDFARSALFSVSCPKERPSFKDKLIFNLNSDFQITYTGFQLSADDDELVLQQVIDYSKNVPLGQPVKFTFKQLVLDIGGHCNTRYYEKVEDSLTRLQATALKIYSSRLGELDSVSLISKFRVINRGKRNAYIEVTIDREMVLFFAGNHFSKFQWAEYKKLSPSARRLCDYILSHRSPLPLSIDNFGKMCATQDKARDSWRRTIRKAADEVVKAGFCHSINVDRSHIKFMRFLEVQAQQSIDSKGENCG